MKDCKDHLMGCLTGLLTTPHQNLTLAEKFAFNTRDKKQIRKSNLKAYLKLFCNSKLKVIEANAVMYVFQEYD